MGITSVVSTDSIRHMMRSFADENQNPLLWASTYHAGECLDAVEVAKAKAKKRDKKLARDGVPDEKCDVRSSDQALGSDTISKKQMAVEGYKAQSEMVIDSLDRLITAWEARRESVIIEGVHLSLNFVVRFTYLFFILFFFMLNSWHNLLPLILLFSSFKPNLWIKILSMPDKLL